MFVVGPGPIKDANLSIYVRLRCLYWLQVTLAALLSGLWDKIMRKLR